MMPPALSLVLVALLGCAAPARGAAIREIDEVIDGPRVVYGDTLAAVLRAVERCGSP